MGCNCGKKKPVVINPQPEVLEIPKVEMVPEPKTQTPDELLTQELNNWNGGQTQN